MKIKVGDNVMVISGKYKGKTGNVSKVYRKQRKVVVEKINMVIKHIKKTAQRPGERITFEAPMHASKVMVVCPQSGKPTRVGYKMVKKGDKMKKERISRKYNESLDKTSSN
jgi:large subunit ribosomal protein L24